MRLCTEMRFVAALLALGLIAGCHGDQKEEPDAYLSRFIADLWLEGADVVKILWRDCSKKLVDVKDVIDHQEYFPKFVRCMRRKTLRALDRSLSTDIVPVAEGVNLVRFELVDQSGNVMPENGTSSWTEKELDEGDWRGLALQRMAKILRTHVLKFDFEDKKSPDKVESRGRRRHHMMTMMMFGVVSIGMVVVPMGFQFLAVLGGKALLLAKMALILASIQGLKKVDTSGYDGYQNRGKIASNPLNYGFYHSYPPYDHFERRSQEWPPPSSLPGTPPPLLSRDHPWNDIDGRSIKSDRLQIIDRTIKTKTDESVTLKKGESPTIAVESKSEKRFYPIYPSQTPVFSSMDSPMPLADLTTQPGEIQADFSMDLPYNGFHFQSPTPVVSA